MNRYFLLLCSLLFAVADNVQAQDDVPRSVLNLQTTDGQVYHFLLTDAQPQMRCQHGQMTVTYRRDATKDQTTTLFFQRDEVSQLTLSDYDPDAVAPPDAAERRVFFDLTAPSVVRVSGLHVGEHVSVCSLDGRAVSSSVCSHGGTVIVDLSRQPRGIYILSTSGHCTFKFQKP